MQKIMYGEFANYCCSLDTARASRGLRLLGGMQLVWLMYQKFRASRISISLATTQSDSKVCSICAEEWSDYCGATAMLRPFYGDLRAFQSNNELANVIRGWARPRPAARTLETARDLENFRFARDANKTLQLAIGGSSWVAPLPSWRTSVGEQLQTTNMQLGFIEAILFKCLQAFGTLGIGQRDCANGGRFARIAESGVSVRT